MTPDVQTDQTPARKAPPGESGSQAGPSKPASPVRIPPDEFLLERFQAVGEETRMEIVRLLADGERCVCELQDAMDAAQSRLSFHLRKLKDAGVVSDRREGRWVYYSLVPTALREMRAFLGEVVAGGDPVYGGDVEEGVDGKHGGGRASSARNDGASCCG